MNDGLPTRLSGSVRLFAWLSLATELVIVGTGGAVRLTESGLGCPTWPTCTAESLIPTEEMGLHGLIEFGNRMMTGVVGIIALIMFVLVWRLRRQRPDLFALATVLAFGVLAQAIVGGVTVLTGLNPFIVGFHFTVSLIMVCVATTLVFRVYAVPGPRMSIAPVWYVFIVKTTAVFVAITVAVGVLTTASGPHSGDAEATRTGFNAELLEHLHAWPAYITVVLTLVLVALSGALSSRARGWLLVLLLVEFAQIAVGLVQANTGLPPLLVGIHMVLACCLAAAMTAVILHLKVASPRSALSHAPAEVAYTGNARQSM